MSKQVNRFSLEEILSPNDARCQQEIKNENPVSEEIMALLSNASKTIGIVAWERKVKLIKENPETSFSILNSA